MTWLPISLKKKIIRVKIKKLEAKTKDLLGYGLVGDARQLSKLITKYFQREIERYRENILKDPEIKINYLLQELKKEQGSLFPDFFSDLLNQTTRLLKKAFLFWVKRFVFEDKKIDFQVSFDLKNQRAEDYAKEKAADLITKIDNYTRKRINKLISKAIKEGRGYDTIREKLLEDYSFSRYRATMIAHNELWNALTNWKHRQFQEYQSHYRIEGRKKSISHPDDRRSEICMINSEQWRIPANEEFASWHMTPLFHVNCRCVCVYRMEKPPD